MRTHNRSSRILFLVLLLVTLATSAHAYVDPGTGSFAIQMLIASVLGVGYAVKSYWSKIKGVFVKSTEQPAQVETAEKPEA